MQQINGFNFWQSFLIAIKLAKILSRPAKLCQTNMKSSLLTKKTTRCKPSRKDYSAEYYVKLNQMRYFYFCTARYCSIGSCKITSHPSKSLQSCFPSAGLPAHYFHLWQGSHPRQFCRWGWCRRLRARCSEVLLPASWTSWPPACRWCLLLGECLESWIC